MEENKQPNENEQPKEQVQENQNEQPKVESQVNQNVNPISNASTYKVSTGAPKKKKGKKGLIALLIFIIILVIAVVAGLTYYFSFYMRPDQVYKRLVESTIDSYTTKIKDLDYTTSKTSLKLDVDIDTDIDEIDEDVLDLINKTDIKVEAQTDNENKKIVVNLESDYDDEDLLNLQMYSDIDGEKTYIQLKDLLNKYIEVEDVDDEFYSLVGEALENQKMTKEEKVSLEKAMNILKKEVVATIKPEYCSSQKEDITINGKNISATKNTIKMNQEQFRNELTTVIKNLKDNEEFLNCFEEKDEIAEGLEELVDDLEDLDTDDKSTIEISIYTQGLVPQVVKVSGIVYDEETDETITMSVTQTEKNTYSIEVSTSEDDEVLTGTFNIEKKSDEEGTLKFGFDIPEFGKVTLNMEYSQKFNEAIDEVDVKNSVKADDLTQSDQQTLMKNLQNSKLYELIENFSGNSSESILGSSTSSSSANTTTSSATETKDNEIISYDDKTKVTFKIPSGYTSRYVSENYRSLDKDDISIKIASQYGDKDKYYETLEDSKEYYEEEDRYENVKLSDMDSIEVEGKTFYYATFSYDYTGIGDTITYETKYVWSEISDKYVVYFEIRNPGDVTAEELNELLTITVKDNK
ncbi:MAG: hypothetical protein ACI4VH_04150 [Clostridia bacterium]